MSCRTQGFRKYEDGRAAPRPFLCIGGTSLPRYDSNPSSVASTSRGSVARL
jgi:hypothetical protein